MLYIFCKSLSGSNNDKESTFISVFVVAFPKYFFNNVFIVSGMFLISFLIIENDNKISFTYLDSISFFILNNSSDIFTVVLSNFVLRLRNWLTFFFDSSLAKPIYEKTLSVPAD